MSKSETTEQPQTPETPASEQAATPETPQATEAAPAAPASPPKNQLARRVAARIAQLEAALDRLGDDPEKQKQARAIRMALKGAHDSMNLRGDKMGPMEAAQMTRWLESTQYLAVPSS